MGVKKAALLHWAWPATAKIDSQAVNFSTHGISRVPMTTIGYYLPNSSCSWSNTKAHWFLTHDDPFIAIGQSLDILLVVIVRSWEGASWWSPPRNESLRDGDAVRTPSSHLVWSASEAIPPGLHGDSSRCFSAQPSGRSWLLFPAGATRMTIVGFSLCGSQNMEVTRYGRQPEMLYRPKLSNRLLEIYYINNNNKLTDFKPPDLFLICNIYIIF